MKDDFEASKCRKEFDKWVDLLEKEELNTYETTLLNILIENFSSIYKTGSSNGKRAKLLGRLIQDKNMQVDKAISNQHKSVTEENSDDVIELTRMTVESFRGFISKCDFDFSKQYTFLYGPNGSGKSSMCEALEFSLLGSIAEAEARRIPLDQFVRNQVTKKYKNPQLYVITSNGFSGIITSPSERNRHSFIEKNRIDQFSHISATTEKSQTERISELFGLSSFNSFVRDFTDNFDNRYLSTSTPLKDAFDESAIIYTQKKDRIIDLQNRIDEQNEVGNEVIMRLQEPSITTIENALAFIGDDSNSDSLIVSEREKYNKVYRGSIEANSIIEVNSKITELLGLIDSIRADRNSLVDRVLDSNSLEFFSAALKLPESDVCPLCQTPVIQTEQNPFKYAAEQVAQLSNIAILKERIESSAQRAVSLLDSVRKSVSNSVISLFLGIQKEFYDPIVVESFVQLNPDVVNCESFLKNLHERWSSDEELINELKGFNKESEDQNKINGARYYLLTDLRSQLLGIQGQIKTLALELAAARKYVENYEKSNAAQIDAVKQEAKAVLYNKRMIKAYETLRKKMVNYNASLPIILSNNLSHKTMEYYNVINSGDAKFEKVCALVLPQTAKEKITITMEDGITSDAMQVLSEGHIKILGLSILLAKATNEKRRFLIFDDIVNAIDDEHRDGVATLLLQHQDFSDVQLIITCHGEQFITKLEEKAGRKAQQRIQRYMFLPADTLVDRGAIIEYTDAKTPLALAQERLKKNELKDAAAKCRQATECLSEKLWKKLAKKYNLSLSVLMRAPKSTPDLHSVVEGLSKNLNGVKGAELLYKDLNQLMGQYTWLLLNKGTHFEGEQPEFERKDIKDLIDLLLKMDEEIDNLKLHLVAAD